MLNETGSPQTITIAFEATPRFSPEPIAPGTDAYCRLQRHLRESPPSNNDPHPPSDVPARPNGSQ